MLKDPTGQLFIDADWLPGMDEKGNVTYTSQRGDNIHTFQRQFAVDGEKALKIFKQAGLSTDATFGAGEAVINGDIVAGITGSEILRGQWGRMDDTPEGRNQKASHIMFAMMHSKFHNQKADNGALAMNVNNYIEGFYVGSSGLNLNNVYIPAKGGGLIKVDQISIAPGSTIGQPPLIYYHKEGGNQDKRLDGSIFASYSFKSARNANASTPFNVLTISVPLVNDYLFNKSY